MAWELSAQALEKHLEMRRRDYPGERVYAFHLEAGVTWSGGVLGCGRVEVVRSELGLREVLECVEGPCVVLTPLEGSRLAVDVRARLAGRGLFRLDPWSAVLPMFGVSRKDERLSSRRALGRALLEHLRGPQEAPSGLLEESQAWMALLRQRCGYDEEGVSVSGLLRWGARRPGELIWLRESAQEELREELLGWVRQHLKEVGALTLEVLLEGSGEEHPGGRALRLGMSLWLSYQEVEARHQGHAEALRIRLEREFPPLTPGRQREGRELGRAAHAAWVQLRQEGCEEVLRRVSEALDAQLERLEARELAVYSDQGEAGWRARLSRLGEVLGERPVAREALEEALWRVRQHEESRRRPEGLSRLEGLCRLLYRPERALEEVSSWSLGELARWYVEEGSFEDQARELLVLGEFGVGLSEAWREAQGRLRRERALLGEVFARRLCEAEGSEGWSRGVLRVDRVLEEVIKPLASSHRVLWVVLDGLSWSVARALLQDEGLRGWGAWSPGDRGQALPMVSALPSVTELSRASLLTGRLCAGGQSEERKGLAAAFEGAGGAQLFHKAEVSGAGGLGEGVKEALGSSTQVVCVVINAVDDQLSGATQLMARWTVEGISPLRALLDLAEDRVVVLCGDHGHVLEEGVSAPEWPRPPRVSGERSARWRQGSPEVRGEVAWSGAQAQVFGRGALSLAWGEGLRYTGPQRGYHGGASLQEVVTPLLALTRRADQDLRPLRFVALQSSPPPWWRFEEAPPQPTRAVAGLLPTAAPSLPWVEALLSSGLYKLRGRGQEQPGDEEARGLLRVLSVRGAAHLGELSRALGLPESATRPQVRALQRRLNVGDRQVLSWDARAERLTLDLALLKEMFGV
jgi:hypothetical protein